jgi:hypothetical protein
MSVCVVRHFNNGRPLKESLVTGSSGSLCTRRIAFNISPLERQRYLRGKGFQEVTLFRQQ